MQLSTFFQQIINGLSIGSVYALIAVGYSLVYSILSFSNFAHSSFLIMGAYTGFFLISTNLMPPLLAIFIAMLVSGGFAMFIERFAYRPIRAKGGKSLYYIIASLGISIFFENFVVAAIGANYRTYPSLLPYKAIKFLGLRISILDLACAGIAIFFLILLEFFLKRTKMGMAIRAAAFDLTTASLMGVNVNFLLSIVFLIAGFLAGIAGVVLGIKYTVYPQLGSLTTKAFIGAILGGLGSLPGAIIGSVCLGVIEACTAAFISSQLRDLIVVLILIIVLIFRPNGIMGVYVDDKV
jgi:branched-chain amino acid transport system permease protein